MFCPYHFRAKIHVVMKEMIRYKKGYRANKTIKTLVLKCLSSATPKLLTKLLRSVQKLPNPIKVGEWSKEAIAIRNSTDVCYH